MKLKKADLLNIGCILSAIPTILFMSWYKWYFAVPGVLLIIMALISVVKMNKISEACCVNISAKTLTAIVIFSVFIVAFSGVGGLFPQSGDNIARNPIFRDLIVKKWPVLYPQMNTGLAYYIGFWLLPALIAKMFGGSFMVGNICLIIVAAIYLTVTALIIISCVEIRHWKMQLLVPLILIIFGGINFIGAIGAYSLADKKDIIISGLGEQYSSISGATYIGNFVAIRQTFNHFLPTLLMVCLYVYMRNKKTYLFQTALLFISSPFSVLSLALTMLIDATISICKEITTQNESFTLRTYGKTIRELFSVPNLCAIPVLLLLLPYFYGTVDGRGVKIVRNTKWFIFGAKSNILLCIVVIFAECGLLLLLLRNQCKHELLYWIAGIGLLVLPFFRFEGNSELELKFTATWLIILMLLLISKYQEALNKSDIIRVICLNSYIVLCIIVFLFEISGTLRVVCVYKSGYGEMKATIESYDNIRISSNKLFASNYTRRNPMNDFFFSILSKADFSEFGKFDIILSQDASTISQIVFTKDNIHYASEISGISAEQLINRAKDMGGGGILF